MVSFHHDCFFKKPSIIAAAASASDQYPEPLLPPPHNGSSSASDTSFSEFPSLLAPDLITVNELSLPYPDVPEMEWLSEFLYECSNDNFSVTGENTAAAAGEASSVAQYDGSFINKADVRKASRTNGRKLRPKSDMNGGYSSSGEGSGKPRCTHCAADETPQWRSGPMGPKTLCNACGVRYKSGRLVPEYRPASSPTFVLSQHSNSHRKVLELRRQKEMMMIKEEAQLE